MRHLRFVLAAVCLVALSACSTPSSDANAIPAIFRLDQPSPVPASTASGWALYTSTDGTFSFRHPPTWNVNIVQTLEGVKLIMRMPDTGSGALKMMLIRRSTVTKKRIEYATKTSQTINYDVDQILASSDILSYKQMSLPNFLSRNDSRGAFVPSVLLFRLIKGDKNVLDVFAAQLGDVIAIESIIKPGEEATIRAILDSMTWTASDVKGFRFGSSASSRSNNKSYGKTQLN